MLNTKIATEKYIKANFPILNYWRRFQKKT